MTLVHAHPAEEGRHALLFVFSKVTTLCRRLLLLRPGGMKRFCKIMRGGICFFVLFCFVWAHFCWMIAVGVDGSVDGACGVGVGVGGVGVCF